MLFVIFLLQFVKARVEVESGLKLKKEKERNI